MIEIATTLPPTRAVGGPDPAGDTNATVAAIKEVANKAAAETHTHLAAQVTDLETYVTSRVNTRVDALVAGAPTALDTLIEIAQRLETDKSAVTSLVEVVGTKAPLASPTFTGTVGGITKAMVGLGNVDNTADSAKPVSTAQAAAIAAKADAAAVLPEFAGPFKTQNANYTILAADNGGLLKYDVAANPATYTLPAGVAAGFTVTVMQAWGGPVTVLATGSAGSLLRFPGTDRPSVTLSEGDTYRFVLGNDSRWLVYYLSGAIPQRQAVAFINHGTDATYPRPEAIGMGIWFGDVEPNNMLPQDYWNGPDPV